MADGETIPRSDAQRIASDIYNDYAIATARADELQAQFDALCIGFEAMRKERDALLVKLDLALRGGY